MNRYGTILTASVVILLAGLSLAPVCFATPPTGKEACERLGGIWERRGLLDTEICNLKTSDAGKECSDSRECVSACIKDPAVTPGSAVSGRCYELSSLLGTCLQRVSNGRAEPVLCVD